MEEIIKKKLDEMNFNLHLDNQSETIAKEQNFFTHIDYFIYSMMYLKHRNNLISDVDLFEEFKIFDLRWDEIKYVLDRLERADYVSSQKFRLSQGYRINHEFSNLLFGSSSNDEEIINKMFSLMKKAWNKIEGWKLVINAPKEVKKIKKEISNMKKDIERSQEYILRNMVAIFAIFVSIFSFILIGAKGVLSLEIVSFTEFFWITVLILVPIIVLLLLTYWLFIKR